MKEMVSKLAKVVSVMAVMTGTMVVLTGCGGPKIDLNEYVTIRESGYSGYGHVEASINWEAVAAEYAEELEFTESALEEVEETLGDLSLLVSPIEALKGSFDLEVEEVGNLKNGDSVQVMFHTYDGVNEIFNAKIKYSDISHELTQLKEVETFDAFEGLTLVYSGAEPTGTVEIKYEGDKFTADDFTCDTYEYLSNGDVVTVSLYNTRMQDYEEKFGMIPAEESKTFTVEGLSTYLTSVDQLSDAVLQKLQEEARKTHDRMEEITFRQGEVTTEEFNYLETYVYAKKDPEDKSGYNSLVSLVYKVRMHFTASGRGQTYDAYEDHYVCYVFFDTILNGDGSIVMDTEYGYPLADLIEVDTGVPLDSWGNTIVWEYASSKDQNSLMQVVSECIEMWDLTLVGSR